MQEPDPVPRPRRSGGVEEPATDKTEKKKHILECRIAIATARPRRKKPQTHKPPNAKPQTRTKP